MRSRTLLVILIGVILTASFSFCGLVEAQTTQIYEYYNTGDDAGNGIYGTNWYGQTFNTTASHTITSVRLRLYKAGTAGYLYVGIRACDPATGLPTGADLTSGIYDGSLLVTNTAGSFREVALTQYTLAANSRYAIVCRGTGADVSNGVFWRSDNTSPTYGGGNYISSSDDGITWGGNTSRDFAFEVWGELSMGITGAQVYESFIEDHDWLFVINYLNEVPPYYPLSNPENYFNLQILHDNTVVSSLPCQQWGRRPGSIYLKADTAATFEWGHNYSVRLYGTYGSYPNVSYTLTPSDWVGQSYSQLDTWCINLANDMQNRDGITYLTDGPEGEVLNTAGGAIFAIGIPWLPEERPGIFQYTLSTIDYQEEDWTNAYPNSLDPWQSWMGPDITVLANQLGGVLGVSGKWALGLVLFLIYILVAGTGIFSGHTVEGLIIASPLLLLSMNWMIIPMALIATVIMIMVYKWVKKEWLEGV